MNLFSKFTSLFDRFRKNRIAALVSFPIEQPNKIVAEKVLPIGSPFFVGQKKLGEIVTAKSESCLMQTALRSGVIFTLKQDEILEEKGDLKANAIVKN